MKHDPLMDTTEACELCQRQISETADAGSTLTPELRAHIEVCAACASFAQHWVEGPPGELAQPVTGFVEVRLRERILDAAARPNVVRFPAPVARRASWSTWMGRIAASLAVAGFSYWLLNPVASPVHHETTTAADPTLTQALTQIENHTRREQSVVQTALVDGGRQVRGDVAWSLSALEL